MARRLDSESEKMANFLRLERRIISRERAVVKVDIKVINASLTQNQCLQCVMLPLTHVEILQPRARLPN